VKSGPCSRIQCRPKYPILSDYPSCFFKFSSWEEPLPPEIVPLRLAVEPMGRRKTSILNGLSAIGEFT
jgi:hypothetical protein